MRQIVCHTMVNGDNIGGNAVTGLLTSLTPIVAPVNFPVTTWCKAVRLIPRAMVWGNIRGDKVVAERRSR